QFRSELAELQRSRDGAEQTHRDELARLEARLQQAGEEPRDVEPLRGEGDQLRTEIDRLRAESDQLRAEGNRLRSEVEDLRRALGGAGEAARDEAARAGAQ